MKYTHGQRVRCSIEGVECGATVSINDGTYYLCQDIEDGFSAVEKFGYKYSWHFEPDHLSNDGVDWIKPISSDIENVYEGCIIENKSDKRKVLGICGKVVFVSRKSDHGSYGLGLTTKELKENGYKILTDEPEELVTITISRKSAEALRLLKEILGENE